MFLKMGAQNRVAPPGMVRCRPALWAGLVSHGRKEAGGCSMFATFLIWRWENAQFCSVFLRASRVFGEVAGGGPECMIDPRERASTPTTAFRAKMCRKEANWCAFPEIFDDFRAGIRHFELKIWRHFQQVSQNPGSFFFQNKIIICI